MIEDIGGYFQPVKKSGYIKDKVCDFLKYEFRISKSNSKN